MMLHVLRDENIKGEEGEFYQFSRGLNITYNGSSKQFERFDYDGRPLEDDDILSVGLQEYHYKNFENFFNMPLSKLADGKGTVATASLRDVLEEYFDNAELPDAEVEGRLVVR
jgi:5'-nucleotidase